MKAELKGARTLEGELRAQIGELKTQAAASREAFEDLQGEHEAARFELEALSQSATPDERAAARLAELEGLQAEQR